MTSTITPGSLIVLLTETLVMDDANTNDHGVTVSNQFTIASISQTVKRVVTIPTSEVGLLAFAANLTAAPGTPQNTYVAGHFNENLVRYVRITNKDDTNHAVLVFKAGTAEFAVILEHGQSFSFNCDDTTGTVATMDASATALTVSLADLDDITALADTASVDLEVFVAST